MNGSVRIARIAGIDVGIHYTWLIALMLVTWSLATSVFPEILPGRGPGLYWPMGLAGALLLFASVLAHELTHSLVARARGLPVQSITLFIFGGVSLIRAEAEDPRDEFLVSVVGPLSSLALAGIFWGLSQVVGERALQALLTYLFLVNLLLAAFNILPGFPLDGGRVLRSIAWGVTGSLRRATDISAYVGHVFALVLIAWGVYLIVSGLFLQGLWTAFIGWFLSSAAEASRREVATQESFRGVRVAEVMDTEPCTVPPTITVAEMVHEYVFHRGHRALPVLEDGRLVGIATTVDVRKVPPERWAETEVREIMTRQPLYTVTPDDDLAQAVRTMAEHDVNQLPVVQDGRLVGMLSRAHIVRFVQLSEEIGLRRIPPPSGAERRAA